MIHYVDRTVTPYRPRLVVLYAGDNDLEMGRTPAQVDADYREFVVRVRNRMPNARIIFIAIKPSPSRRAYLPQMRRANQLVRADIARDSLAAYADVFAPMLRADGQPRPELFQADSLHMTSAGYVLWRTLLAPLVH